MSRNRGWIVAKYGAFCANASEKRRAPCGSFWLRRQRSRIDGMRLRLLVGNQPCQYALGHSTRLELGVVDDQVRPPREQTLPGAVGAWVRDHPPALLHPAD